MAVNLCALFWPCTSMCVFVSRHCWTNVCVNLCFAEKNGLSFLETSALDSSNVELAFQTILTGELHICFLIHLIYIYIYLCVHIKCRKLLNLIVDRWQNQTELRITGIDIVSRYDEDNKRLTNNVGILPLDGSKVLKPLSSRLKNKQHWFPRGAQSILLKKQD